MRLHVFIFLLDQKVWMTLSLSLATFFSTKLSFVRNNWRRRQFLVDARLTIFFYFRCLLCATERLIQVSFQSLDFVFKLWIPPWQLQHRLAEGLLAARTPISNKPSVAQCLLAAGSRAFSKYQSYFEAWRSQTEQPSFAKVNTLAPTSSHTCPWSAKHDKMALNLESRTLRNLSAWSTNTTWPPFMAFVICTPMFFAQLKPQSGLSPTFNSLPVQ